MFLLININFIKNNSLIIKGKDAKNLIDKMNNPKLVSKEEYEKAEMIYNKVKQI